MQIVKDATKNFTAALEPVYIPTQRQLEGAQSVSTTIQGSDSLFEELRAFSCAFSSPDIYYSCEDAGFEPEICDQQSWCATTATPHAFVEHKKNLYILKSLQIQKKVVGFTMFFNHKKNLISFLCKFFKPFYGGGRVA
jgi:hypothetical protein